MTYRSLFDSSARVYGRASQLLLRDRAFWPIQTFIEITARCNLRCSFCLFARRFDSASNDAGTREELSTDELRSVIDQIPRLTLITFTGGEPFMRQDLVELVEHARRRHRCHIITNATLIGEDTAVRLVELAPRRPFGPGLMFIGVSLHGDRETHDRVTGRAGSFDQAVATIRTIQEKKASAGARFPRFHITSVISAATVERLPAIVATAAELGVGICNFPLEDRKLDEHIGREVVPADLARPPQPPDAIPERVLRDVYATTERIARERGVEVRWPRMPFEDVVAHYQNRFDLHGFRCYSPWTKMYISYYGAAHPCSFLEAGNVRDEPVLEIWNGDVFRAFRRRLRAQHTLPTCPGCCELVKRH